MRRNRAVAPASGSSTLLRCSESHCVPGSVKEAEVVRDLPERLTVRRRFRSAGFFPLPIQRASLELHSEDRQDRAGAETERLRRCLPGRAEAAHRQDRSVDALLPAYLKVLLADSWYLRPLIAALLHRRPGHLITERATRARRQR